MIRFEWIFVLEVLIENYLRFGILGWNDGLVNKVFIKYDDLSLYFQYSCKKLDIVEYICSFNIEELDIVGFCWVISLVN